MSGIQCCYWCREEIIGVEHVGESTLAGTPVFCSRACLKCHRMKVDHSNLIAKMNRRIEELERGRELTNIKSKPMAMPPFHEITDHPNHLIKQGITVADIPGEFGYDVPSDVDGARCPNCRVAILGGGMHYCFHCGIRLRWKDKHENAND